MRYNKLIFYKGYNCFIEFWLYFSKMIKQLVKISLKDARKMEMRWKLLAINCNNLKIRWQV